MDDRDGQTGGDERAGRGRKRLSELVIPHCTYTDPEGAQVGVTPQEAVGGDGHRDAPDGLSQVERAVIDGAADGFAALYTHDGRLVGATYVADHVANPFRS